MVDEIHDRTYQNGRAQFHAGIDQALERLRCSAVTTFRLINAIQFDAPWSRRSKDVGCA